MQIHRSTDPSRPQARTLAVLVSLACLHMVPAHAQSTAPRNAHAALPEVVVSGSRSEQLSDELPLSIDVIDATQTAIGCRLCLGTVKLARQCAAQRIDDE